VTDQPESTLEDRVESLETGQSKILARLDELLTGAHRRAEQHEAEHLDRPTTVQEQVRMELERKEQEARAKADREAEASQRETLAQRLARLEETPPVQPQPRRQRVMWGKR